MITLENQFPEIRELLLSYPKAGKKLCSFIGRGLEIFRRLEASKINGASTMPEMTEEIVRNATISIIEINARSLLDWLDTENLFLSTALEKTEGDKLVWRWSLTRPGFIHSSPLSYENRTSAERAGYSESFKLLEASL